MYPLMLTVMGEIPLDSPAYPTCYSGIGRTVEFGGLEWDSGFHGQSHLSYMLQWDRTDSPTYPTCYSGIGRTVPPILHVTVG